MNEIYNEQGKVALFNHFHLKLLSKNMFNRQQQQKRKIKISLDGEKDEWKKCWRKFEWNNILLSVYFSLEWHY